MHAPRLAALELRKFRRGRLPRAAMAALLLLPLLYGALYLWSFWDPYARLDRIPVALVNDDRGTEAGGEAVRAGDRIAEGLLGSGTFDWRETDAEDAAKGVEEGRYYLSLTIPDDFSSRVASSGGDDPRTGALKVRTNDANNYIVGQISRSVFAEVRTAASAKTSRGFYDKIFVSFSDIHDKTVDAGRGADRLHKGAGDAEDGADRLADGLDEAALGSRDLVSGLSRLHGGAGRLSDGARQAADGTQKLADRVNDAADRARPLLRDHGKEIGDSARRVANASKTIGDNLGDLPDATAKAAKDARRAAADLRVAYDDQCTGTDAATATAAESAPTAACPALKRAADTADDVARLAADVDRTVRANKPALDRLSADLDRVHDLATEIADASPHLATTLDSAVRKVDALNDGVQKIADGADDLAEGTGDAHRGARDLHAGINGLGDGADTLVTGLFKLSDGADRLSTGLHDGAEKIPDYTADERDDRTSVMSDPVRLATHDPHKAANYGTGFAPYFIPLALWVGSMVGYMLISPLSSRALSTGAPAWRIAFAGWLPVTAVGALQAGTLLAVLHWALGLQLARALGTMGFVLLTVACFAAILQWLNARFGPAGRLLALALLMLQLTSAGGTYPVQTSPGFFNAIHPFLPMSYVVEGLRHLISGGGLGPVWRACAVLAAFGVLALALTTWSAARRQVWTLDRLHPELSL